ncbi:hypothetical protein [Fluviispira vulneris]|nr:hypothetical protein [Fluviispira vulneris]
MSVCLPFSNLAGANKATVISATANHCFIRRCSPKTPNDKTLTKTG